MPYSKTIWNETVAITDARLNNQENGIADAYDYIDAQIAIANQNVIDAKTPIASAITNKGVLTSSSDTFATIASNINAITAVKNIQQGFLLVPTGAFSTYDLTLSSAVNVNKSIIIANKRYGDKNGYFVDFMWEFLDSTTIRLTRSTSSYDDDDYRFVYTVIEFHDWVNVQTGRNSTTFNGLNEYAINTVNPSKSFAVCTNRSSTNVSGGILARAYVKDANTLVIDGTQVTARWFVVDLSGT